METPVPGALYMCPVPIHMDVCGINCNNYDAISVPINQDMKAINHYTFVYNNDHITLVLYS